MSSPGLSSADTADADTGTSKFLYPVVPLHSDRVSLIPFNKEAHSPLLFEAINRNPELVKWIPHGPWATLEDFNKFYDGILTNPKIVCYAVFNQAQGEEKGEEFAGVIALLNTEKENAKTEIGFVVTLTKFHRTHVTSHSVGLLLLYTLNHPSDSPPGLGLRRVEWRANSRNQPSLNTARRMGFTLEGILRWAWVLPEEKDGNGLDVSRLPDETGVKMGVGRDSAVLAICWDDWLNGGREKVEAIMKRKE